MSEAEPAGRAHSGGSPGEASAPTPAGAQDSIRRALTTLAEGNRILLQARSREDLLQQMCEAIVASGGYAFAWYGRPVHDAERTVAVVAVGGDDGGYLDDITVSWSDGPLGRGPTGTAIRTRTTQVRNNFAEDPRYGPWRQATADRGLRSSISLPVIVDGELDGALMVYSHEADAFDSLAQDLLEILAAVLGYGWERLEVEHLQRATLDSLMDPHVTLRPVRDEAGTVVDFIYVDANRAACEHDRTTRDELLGRRLLELVPGQAASGLLESYAAVVETGIPMVLDDHPYHDEMHSGEMRYFDIRGVRVGDHLSLTWRDVTDRREAAEALAASETRYRILAENATDLVFTVDTESQVTWMSPSVTTVLGYSREDLLGRSARVLISEEDRTRVASAVASSEAGRGVDVPVRLRTKTGDELWMAVSPRPLTGDDGAVTGYVVGIRDVDAEIRAGQRLEHELAYDSLTGLARKELALTRIQSILDGRSAPGWALLCLGVYGLTAVNQAFTYAVGDEVLRTVADRLVAAVGAHDRVARIAGDEFLVLSPAIESAADAALGAEQLLAAVRGPMDVAGTAIQIDGTVGIALDDGDGAQNLMRDATAAMRQAATNGPGSWGFLDGDVADEARRTLATQSALRDAVRRHEIQPWFMPIVDLADGTVVGYEALARWLHADGTVTEPVGFLDSAVRSGLIVDIDKAILRGALEALTTLPPEVHVAVNVSADSLVSGGYFETVVALLRRAGVEPSRLHLEVTETTLLRLSPEVVAAVEEIAGRGVTWWVDDFGTGYSSIVHLRDLPVTGIKLDRSFTAAVGAADSRPTRLARGLVALAHGLELATVAEGIETVDQERVLRDQGWQHGQGWLYGKAAPLPR